MSANQQPQGQPNALSAFGFKPADASNAANSNTTSTGFGSTPSIFGGTNVAQSMTNTGLFGSAPSNQPAQTGITSGSGGASNPTTSGTNIFGSGGASNPTTSGTNIFGSGVASNSTTSGTNIFGSGGASNSTTSGTNIFGSGGASNPTTSGTNIFGNLPSKGPSGGSLFANVPKKPETTPALGATSATPSAFSAFSSLATPKDSTENDKGAKAGPGTPAGSGPKDSSKEIVLGKDPAPAPSPFAGFNLNSNKDASAAKPPATSGDAGATATAPSTTAPTVTSVPAPSMLRGKTVEDIVNRWTTELEVHTREFSQFAGEVAVWDRTLIENGNYISALYATVLAAESTQTSLDQSLDHVEQQQRQLTATLDQYEKSASEILHGPGGIMTSTEGLGLADSERDKSYAVAANLYTQLDDLSRSLTQMVESVNSLDLSPGPSRGSEDASQEDAISTIAGILNAHLSSLQWIDGALNEMDGKIKDAERKIKDSSARGGVRRDGTSKSRGYGLGSSRR